MYHRWPTGFHQPLCISLFILFIQTITQTGELFFGGRINLRWLQTAVGTTADGVVARYKWLLAAHGRSRQESKEEKQEALGVGNSLSPRFCPRGLGGRVLDYVAARADIQPVVLKGDHQHPWRQA